MARSFEVQRGRFPVKRIKWILFTIVMLAVGISILRPTEEELQRVVSPDGSRVGTLSRFTYVQPHLQLRLGDVDERLDVVWTSPAITNAFETLQPRLAWTGTPSRLVLLVQGERLWLEPNEP